MICPRCKHDMIVVERRQIELDYCPRCEGVWFDSGELNLLLQCLDLDSPELMVKSIVNLPAATPTAKPLRCPICGQGMKEVAISKPVIHLDVCNQADGLWFDGGEVHQLLKQVGRDAVTEQPVLEFLEEMFGGEG